MELRALLVAMLLADARLPTGAGSHSAGLEAALGGGLSPIEMPRYLDARLRTVGALDAAAAVLAHRAAVDSDLDGIARLDRAIGARTPSAPMRAASRQLGRGMVRTGSRLAPDDPVLGAIAGTAPYRPIATGVVAAALGTDEHGAAAVVLYDEAQTIASAALKLHPGDPVEATTWVRDAVPVIERVARDAVTAVDAGELPATSTPAMEHWIDRHSEERRRLFVS